MPQTWERVVPYLIFDRYQEIQRRYHTLQHINEMFNLYDMHFTKSPYLSVDGHTALYFAIWYHDAVYEPLRSDNEERSAVLALRELGDRGFEPHIPEAVARLVRSTATHAATSIDERMLSDLDLAILGANHERYKEYVGQVREEFHEVTDVQWVQGRAAVVDGFLKRRIFHYLTHLEQQAKNNLGWELIRLQGHP